MFHFDFAGLSSMASFDVFLAEFEAMIVRTLIANRSTLMADQAIETLLKVALRFYDKNLLEQNIAHSINRVMSGRTGHTYAYSANLSRSKKDTEELETMLARYKSKEYKKTVFVSDLAKVAKHLSKVMNDGDVGRDDPALDNSDHEFAAALRLIHDAIISKELSRRHP